MTRFWLFGYKRGASRKNSTRISNTILIKNKYASQTPRKAGKNLILLIVSAIALCVSPAIALADSCIGQTNWSVPSGNWFEGTNWSGGVPNSSTSAQIKNGGTVTIGSTGAESCDLTLGFNATQSGRVVVDHGALDIQFDAAVGTYGNGVLTITNGGTVTAALATLAALQDISGSVSVGTVSVDGGSFTVGAGIYVGGDANGYGGTGLLTAINGATVTAANVRVWKSGTLTGNGTVITTNGTTTVDGTVSPNGGGGTLTVDGALVLNNPAATQCNVTPQDPSTTPQVSVSGQVSLGGHLLVTMTGDFSSAPTRFTLLNADSVAVGHITFGSTSITYFTGHCWHPVITYDYTNHVHVYLDRVYDCS